MTKTYITSIENTGSEVIITEVGPHRVFKHHFRSKLLGNEAFAQMYLDNREDVQRLGEAGALQKWADEEAVQRRALGLK